MTRTLIVLCAVLTVVCLSSAEAEEPTAITLSCDGTTKVYLNRQESINSVTKMDVVVNIAERRVMFDGNVAHIDEIHARTIFFGGDSVKATGYIDGKTGAMTAITNMDRNEYYELVCPAATVAFSELHDVASDSDKVELKRRRATGHAPISGNDKMTSPSSGVLP
jgi:hypothetical protein